jgi:hypothetical protein
MEHERSSGQEAVFVWQNLNLRDALFTPLVLIAMSIEYYKFKSIPKK